MKDLFNLPPDHFIDIHLTDLLGTFRTLTVPTERMTPEFMEEGLCTDGSSYPGWQPIYASDMIIRPDPETFFINPFEHDGRPRFGLLAGIFDPHTDEPYSRDPRYVAQKAQNYLKSTGLADQAFLGPEAEFFVFDHVCHENKPELTYFSLEHAEAKAQSLTGRGIVPRLGFAVSDPVDSKAAFREELALNLKKMGFAIEVLHHEAASGQHEIGFRYDSLVKAADRLMMFKYAVKNAAAKKNLSATFMPKPFFGDHGSGLHLNISLSKGGEPLFNGSGYGGLSEMGLFFIGGILAHAQSLCAFTNPTCNSYHRLVPGFEAPNRLAYSARNRSAAIRIPAASNPKARRVEARFPDPSANGYLAMSALLMAGLDGIERRIDPGLPLDRDIYALAPEENYLAPYTPASLSRALEALEKDNEYLKKGDVFTVDLIERYLRLKWDKEVTPLRQRPHPYEFELYYDC